MPRTPPPPDPAWVEAHQASGHLPPQPWSAQRLLGLSSAARPASVPVEAPVMPRLVMDLNFFIAELTRVDRTADIVSGPVWATTLGTVDKLTRGVLRIPPRKVSGPSNSYMVKASVQLIKRISHLEAESGAGLPSPISPGRSRAWPCRPVLISFSRLFCGTARSRWEPPGSPRTCASGRQGSPRGPRGPLRRLLSPSDALYPWLIRRTG